MPVGPMVIGEPRHHGKANAYLDWSDHYVYNDDGLRHFRCFGLCVSQTLSCVGTPREIAKLVKKFWLKLRTRLGSGVGWLWLVTVRTLMGKWPLKAEDIASITSTSPFRQFEARRLASTQRELRPLSYQCRDKRDSLPLRNQDSVEILQWIGPRFTVLEHHFAAYDGWMSLTLPRMDTCSIIVITLTQGTNEVLTW
jgi:hypothetical protein